MPASKGMSHMTSDAQQMLCLFPTCHTKGVLKERKDNCNPEIRMSEMHHRNTLCFADEQLIIQHTKDQSVFH